MTAQTNAASKRTLRYLDDRLGSAGFMRRAMNKVFPDHWSFMIGEIALYSFVILLLTGVYLSLFFHASSEAVVYHGRYAPLRGVSMSQAYSSTLHLSFDVRGGLLMRQIHHWAALVFMASIVLHLCRVFFTGAFRNPRTINWYIGVGLLTLSLLEGFAGYSLPDDLLSATGFCFLSFGGTAMLGPVAQVNPVWLSGPYDPAQVSAGSQPDWYLMFLDGGLRMFPNWETSIFGHTISWNILIPGVVLPGVMFTL